MKYALSTTLICLLTSSGASAQTTISFDHQLARVSVVGYSEGGLIFDDASDFESSVTPDFIAIPSNGTSFLSSCGICRPQMNASDGGLFDLLEVDLGEFQFFGFGPAPTLVYINGVKEDGTTVQVDLTTDGFIGFDHFDLSEFAEELSDLVSAEITTFSPYLSIGIDNIVVRIGLDKPSLILSPPSGVYLTSQAFDIALAVPGADQASVVAASLDGADFLAEFTQCAVEGKLDEVPGITFRCPFEGELGAGSHSLAIAVELGDGSSLSTSVDWEVRASSEP